MRTLDKTAPIDFYYINECGWAGRTSSFTKGVYEGHAFFCKAVNVGCLIAHEAMLVYM